MLRILGAVCPVRRPGTGSWGSWLLPALMVLLVGGSPGAVAEDLFGSKVGLGLYVFDPVLEGTGPALRVGTDPLNGCLGFATATDGTLYTYENVIDKGGAVPRLKTIDRCTGATAYVGDDSGFVGSVFSLAISPSGELYGAGHSLVRIDLGTGIVTSVVPITSGDLTSFLGIYGMDFAADGTLYGAWIGTDSTTLVTIDPGTGVATTLWTFPQQLFRTIAFDSLGRLLASNFAGTDAGLLQIDLSDGSTTLVGPNGLANGMDFAPDCETGYEICGNGEDDNGNGLTDLEDPVCAALPPEQGLRCSNGVDDDDDGLTDCADPGCAAFTTCGENGPRCSDTLDNDSDGLVDCADPGCATSPACVLHEVDCENGLDDDNDGFADCDDPECVTAPACEGLVEVDCSNGLDDDGDGLTDCEDSNCAQTPGCSESGPALCSDSIDNDNDGLIDCADPDCSCEACPDDGNSCTEEVVFSGRCEHRPAIDGQPCDDGNSCTTDDACLASVCTGGAAIDCGSDLCNPSACDPGSGECVPGDPVTCTASDQCHDAGVCDPATGLCSDPPRPDGADCSDDDACTTTDACQAGACVAGTPVTCTASDQCHDAGVCDPSTGLCSDPASPDGADCSDGDACTTTDACQAGACIAGTPVTCTASDQCHDAGVCDPGTGLCSDPASPDGTPCSDGNASTTGDACEAGACIGGTSEEEVCDGVDNDGNGIVDDAATLQVEADVHTIGGGPRPTTVKTPYSGLPVRIYDKSEGSCARVTCGGISWQHYPCIAAQCPAVAQDTTDSDGLIDFTLAAGDYLVIGSDGTDKHLGVSASDLGCGAFMRKYLQRMVTANGKSTPAKTTVRTGSELLMIEPEYVEWTSLQELYPIVLESVGDWSVTTSVTPPEGFVADHDSLSAQVTTESEAVQFTITDVGSDWIPTEVRHLLVHGARREIVRNRIGLLVGPDLARLKGLDRTGHVLDENGRPVPENRVDPRLPRPAEIAGWIEPSAADTSWIVKVRVADLHPSVAVAVVDERGRTVRRLAAGRLASGEHAFAWDGRDQRGRTLAAGDYSFSVAVGTTIDAARFLTIQGSDTSTSASGGGVKVKE